MSQPALRSADELFERSQSVLAGGVSASMRMHPYLGRPFYLSRGLGSRIYDLDDRSYIDFNMSNGAALLGHGHPAVEARVTEGLRAGIIAGAETPFHEELANLLTEIIPCAERVRFSSTGSEVTTLAVRLARHATGRNKLLKFEGHFHGLTETFLFQPAATASVQSPTVPSSGGVPASGGHEVVITPWNDLEAFEKALAQHRNEIAAVIMEPIWYNAGCLLPQPGFLERVRELTKAEGIILIFDEVLSGFRMALGGVQEYSGVTPDLSTLAKALSNGMPLSALLGRADIMEGLAPNGPVAHSGTYSGHLLSVLAGLATLGELRKPGVYDRINATGDRFYRDLQEIFDRHSFPARAQGLGARFGLYFGQSTPVLTYADAIQHDHELHRRFVVECLDRGVYFHAFTKSGAPGHAGFSLAHTDEELATALTAIDEVVGKLTTMRRT